MITALLLIFDPANTWERIAKAQHGLGRILLVTVMPLLIFTCALEGYGLIKFGRERGVMQKTKAVPQTVVIRYTAFTFASNVLLVFGTAALLKMLAEGFHRRHPYSECFATTAYSLSPLFLCRALNAIPGLNHWITWAVGIFLALAALYRGLPRMMKPDPSNALGVYLMASLLFIFASGAVAVLCMMVLDEKILADLKLVLAAQ